MIVKNRLLNFKNCFIYQNDDNFAFSLDSVLLANFVSIKLSDKHIMDFACGNAPIPMLLTFRTKAFIDGIDIQAEAITLGNKSIYENNMGSQITLKNIDINFVDKEYSSEFFDVITCNPPYFKYNSKCKYTNISVGKSIARHEVLVDLDTIVKKASYLLKNGGTFALVHRPDRLVEIIDVMRKYKIEPKKLQFCYPKKDRECNLILIEGNKNGNSGLKVLNPIIVHNDNGEYSSYIKKMFGSDE